MRKFYDKNVKVKLKPKQTHILISRFGGSSIQILGYFDELNKKSWKESKTNPESVIYSVRMKMNNLPDDDEVLVCIVDDVPGRHLIHVSEIA